MRYRLDLLEPNTAWVCRRSRRSSAGLEPMPGARERSSMRTASARTQVIILSDTFQQFATPFMRQLAWPTIMCHRLLVTDDEIVGYELRQQDQKRKAVEAFRSLNFSILACG